MANKNQYGDFSINRNLEYEGWSIDGEYINAHKECVFICPNGHEKKTSWCALRLSFYCGQCNDGKIAKEVLEYVGGIEWELNFVKNRVVGIRCGKGHDFSFKTIADMRKKLKKSPRCYVCKKMEYAESIRCVFEESGWEVVTAR